MIRLDPRRWPSPVVFGLTLILVLVFSAGIAGIGTRLMGSAAFDAARQAALPWLLVWRWLLYATLIVCWLRRWKPRVVQRLDRDEDGGEQARGRLKRLEWLCLGAMLCIELVNLSDWLRSTS